MDFQLLYTQRALKDLAEIIGHLAEDDADAASRFGNSLLDHVGLLPRFPRMGGVIEKRSHVRKLVHSPILVYYRVQENTRVIEVLRFRLGQEDRRDVKSARGVVNNGQAKVGSSRSPGSPSFSYPSRQGGSPRHALTSHQDLAGNPTSLPA